MAIVNGFVGSHRMSLAHRVDAQHVTVTHRVGACLLVVAGVCLMGCGKPDLETVRKFQAAQQAFDDAESADEFLRAAGLYDELLEAGFVSGAVLYNQGNAYMRANRPGLAVACYRQAQRFRPRDPYLEANLQNALRAQPPSTRSVADLLFFWKDWISYGGKFQLSACLFVLAFVAGIAAPFVTFRSAGNRLAWAALLVAVTILLSAGYDWYRFDAVKHGVVIANEVIARKGNADSYEPAFTQPLAETTEFRVLDQRAGWLLIRLANDREGWVREADVVIY